MPRNSLPDQIDMGGQITPEYAKVSVGLQVGLDSEAVSMLRLVLAEGHSLIAKRNQIEDRAVVLLEGLPDYQLLTSKTGIGPINAL